jgi:hypothetical protein
MQRDRIQCFIQVEAAVVDRMRAMRSPGESYRDVISGSSNSRRGGGGHEIAAKDDARSDSRDAADGARVEAPRCAREERYERALTNVRLQGKGLLLGLRSPLALLMKLRVALAQPVRAARTVEVVLNCANFIRLASVSERLVQREDAAPHPFP